MILEDLQLEDAIAFTYGNTLSMARKGNEARPGNDSSAERQKVAGAKNDVTCCKCHN